jgi:hypothetical protein
MRATLLFIIAFMLTVPAIGQPKYSFDSSKQPYMLVDDIEVLDLKLLVISPDKIESITVFKDSNAIRMYGDKAIAGAVILKTKPNTKFLRITDLLEMYNISPVDKKLRICINKTLVSRPDLILIEASEISGVEITTDRKWIHAEDANSTERFLNIIIAIRERLAL